MYAKSLSTLVVIAALCLSLPGLVGCGGGGNAPGRPSSQQGGRVQMTVHWPEASSSPSRYVPPYAQSLVLELYKEDAPQQRYQLFVNRPDEKPSTQTVGFDYLLPVGRYALAVVARLAPNGQGATVAAGVANVEVTSGETAQVEVVLDSTLKRLEVPGQPLVVRKGSSLQLRHSGVDPDGKVILLAPGALTWSVVSGGEYGSVTPDGLLTGTGDGTVRVRVTEEGAGLSAEADVRVADQAFFQILNQPLEVKAGTSLQMAAAMVDLNGSVSPLPEGSTLRWSIASGDTYAGITPEGVLTGTADGVARVRVTEEGSGLVAEADVTVKAYGIGVNVGVD